MYFDIVSRLKSVAELSELNHLILPSFLSSVPPETPGAVVKA